MFAVLAFGEVAVVAQGAVIGRIAVIEPGAGEFFRIVADGTILCRRNMRRQWLALGVLSVVTGCTVVVYPRMTKHDGSKVAGGVTDAAILCRRNMPQSHALCRSPIVTGGATVDDPGMIIDGAAKVGSVVANSAILAC